MYQLWVSNRKGVIAKLKQIIKSLTNLARVKANQNGTFLFFVGKAAFENLLLFKKKLENLRK